MKNADMPAMPQDYVLWCESIGDCPTLATGLTKREYFAAMAMQGMVRRDSEPHPGALAYDAVVVADALLAELERTK